MFRALILSVLALQALAEDIVPAKVVPAEAVIPAEAAIPANDATPLAADDDLYFWLFTRSNANNPIRLRPGSLASANIPAKPIKLLVHGWEDSIDADWYAPAITAYLSKEDVNVIAYDWEKHAAESYISAISRAREGAVVIGNFFVELVSVSRITFSDIHIIGHSLGAHIAGYAGKTVFERTGQRIARCTGLDPAGPFWNGNAAADRLDKTDCAFVDVIHTDGSILGFGDPIGDADFYPNGGTAFQEGCTILTIGCSHNRAPEYFTESILRTDNFVGLQCASERDFDRGNCQNNVAAIMGDGATSSRTGTFYLKTNRRAPYGLGTHGY